MSTETCTEGVEVVSGHYNDSDDLHLICRRCGWRSEYFFTDRVKLHELVALQVTHDSH